MPKITRTIGPFHFEDLDPKRFEDLIRALANDFKDWQSIEATGRSGSDDGIDVRGYERIAKPAESDILDEDEESDPALHPMQGNTWIFQCKREKEIGPKRVSAILAEVDENDPPYGFILAAPANFSKASYDTFRFDLVKKGVMEFYLWGRAELEGMLLLPKNDRVLFTFFGISLVSRRRSRSTEIRGKVVNKNKLLRIMGEGKGHWPVLLRDTNDEHYPFEEQYPDFNKNPRWKRFEARRIHPQGLIVRHQHWYAYLDVDKKEFDFTVKVSLIQPHHVDDDDWTARQKEGELRDAIEDFWDHLPNRNKAEYCKNSLVRFEDMLVIDEKGITPDRCPHIFVDFQNHKGPFSGSHDFLEVRHGYSEPERISLKEFKRIKVFPEEFSTPTIGTVHVDGVVQLDSDTHRLLVNGNEGIREICVMDGRYTFLKERDVFMLKSARDNSLKYFQVTHVKSTTVGEHFAGADREFRKEQLERRLDKELVDSDVINVFEFKQTYDWRIERYKG
ncbi:hypothetical protein CQ12_32345 [Bradyrhizobium jicamae]|uniref:Uncharacterized protein n=1 Tax=Bradyrhizobium jicamae TaxID=280332 RepID=A0A0R3M3Q1_9BRAD|nr:restriction endonuclease [Bradyrhizobium jicamae]KRR14930.1 hypothetical protein CQ12_32345 [Bradyrhizobium jicamae]